MRVLLDTNILISALLFPRSAPAAVVETVLQEDRLVLTQWIIDELHEVIGRKRPDLLPALHAFLEAIDYELAQPGESTVAIFDPDDQPILDAAVANAVDVLVTGDKHFLRLEIGNPAIRTARQFLDERSAGA